MPDSLPSVLPVDPVRPTRTALVMAHLRERLARGGTGAGTRLPSVRRCAETLGVSKSTVVEAYERLVADGEVEARRGSGFYAAARPRRATLAEATPPREPEVDPLWVMRNSLSADEAILKPGCGWLPEDWMPDGAIRRALRAEARGPAASLVGYARPLGHEPLRAHLSRRLAERGVEAAPDGILLTDSGTAAIDLVCRLLVRPNDFVLVDDPCYFNMLNILRAHGARIVGVPYTQLGPDLDAFATALRAHRPRLYLTTATLHNPTGATPTPSVLHRLLRLAAEHDVAVVEDDIFADFEEASVQRLAALDGLERVIHLGSFSKTLSASLRCGFVVARPEWIDALTDLKLATTFGSNDLAARGVHRLLAEGSYRRHLTTIRARLARARSDVSRRLADLGFEIWTEPSGGPFLWARLPDRQDAVEVSRRALREGVLLAPGNVFSVGELAGDFLRFNVAQCDSTRSFDVLRDAMRLADLTLDPPAAKERERADRLARDPVAARTSGWGARPVPGPACPAP